MEEHRPALCAILIHVRGDDVSGQGDDGGVGAASPLDDCAEQGGGGGGGGEEWHVGEVEN